MTNPTDKHSPDPDYRRWLAEITRYESESAAWEEKGRKIVRRYKDERSGPSEDNPQRYNILWSNLQVLLPAVYAKNPVPEVERRYRDDDPVGRQAAEVLERCLDYIIKTHAFKDTCRCAILDRFLAGRGVVWVRYVPHFRDAGIEGTTEEQEEGVEVTDETDEIGAGKIDRMPGDVGDHEVVDYEECIPDYVHWQDFGHTVARTWAEVRAVWRIAYLTREECVDRFGQEIGAAIPLSASHADKEASGLDANNVDVSKSMIYEFWDKPSQTAYWLCKDYPDGLLDQRIDPLQLSGFFPCARPLLATLGNDSLIPVPDFVLYQDQADELDELTARIASITRAIKVAGVYDKSAEGIERVLTEGVENQLVPVDSWAMFAEKGGLKGCMELLPMQEISQTLLNLYEARERVKADLYEITGLSDILRGANDPAETATATRMKGAFASIRLRDMQDEVARFVCDIVRIMGEIVARHFGQETLAQISGINLLVAEQKRAIQMQSQAQIPPALQTLLNAPAWEEVDALLKNDAARNFRIDVETDSTIADDEEKDRAERLQFLDTTSAYIEKIMGAAQQAPQLGPLLGELLMFGVRGFRIGRTLENAFEATLAQLEKSAQNPPPQAPGAEQVKGQIDLQLARIKAQADAQSAQQKVQGDIRIEQVKAQLQWQLAQAQLAAQQRNDQRENQLEAQRQSLQTQQEVKLEEIRAHLDRQSAAMQSQLEMIVTRLNNQTKIDVAEIAANAKINAARTDAEVWNAKHVQGEN